MKGIRLHMCQFVRGKLTKKRVSVQVKASSQAKGHVQQAGAFDQQRTPGEAVGRARAEAGGRGGGACLNK